MTLEVICNIIFDIMIYDNSLSALERCVVGWACRMASPDPPGRLVVPAQGKAQGTPADTGGIR